MTPKEKAIELSDKMFNGFQFTIDDYTAKQCAIIAVDEILNILPFDSLRYWSEVRTEIELL